MFFSRADGAWIARVSLGVIDGRRVRHKVRAPTERAARAELERLQRAYSAGGDPATMTLDAYLADWLAGVRPTVRASTHTSYAGHVRLHISPLLGGILVARLRPADVRRLIAHLLAARLSPATVRLVVTTLRIALGHAVRERAIPDNPADVRLPRAEREPVRPLTAEMAERILRAVEGDSYEALYRLLLGSGMRLGEAVGLDWRDVELDEAFVVVRTSKTKVRAVPLSDDAVAALRVHRARAPLLGPEVPVFLGPRTGRRLSGHTVSHAFPRLLEQHGLPRMRVHDLRHGTATLMLAQGTPMRVIAEQLGHANPSLTAKTYAHVVPEAQRSAIRSIGSRIGSRNA